MMYLCIPIARGTIYTDAHAVLSMFCHVSLAPCMSGVSVPVPCVIFDSDIRSYVETRYVLCTRCVGRRDVSSRGTRDTHGVRRAGSGEGQAEARSTIIYSTRNSDIFTVGVLTVPYTKKRRHFSCDIPAHRTSLGRVHMLNRLQTNIELYTPQMFSISTPPFVSPTLTLLRRHRRRWGPGSCPPRRRCAANRP